MRTILIFCFAFSIVSTLHAQTVCYGYDAAGNRTIKILGPCNSFLVGPDEPSVQQALTPHEQLGADKASDSALGEAAVLATGKVFPNPNKGQFSLVLDKEASAGAWFELYDAKGALKSKLLAEGTSFAFDLSGSPAGEYFLFLRTLGGSYGQWKVVKE